LETYREALRKENIHLELQVTVMAEIEKVMSLTEVCKADESFLAGLNIKVTE
jgi:hypothetical protein